MENKKLYNIYDKEYLSKKLHNEQQDRITCSFYKYTPIQNLEILRDNLYENLGSKLYYFYKLGQSCLVL